MEITLQLKGRRGGPQRAIMTQNPDAYIEVDHVDVVPQTGVVELQGNAVVPVGLGDATITAYFKTANGASLPPDELVVHVVLGPEATASGFGIRAILEHDQTELPPE